MNRDSAVDFIFLGQRRESAAVERTDRHVEVFTMIKYGYGQHVGICLVNNAPILCFRNAELTPVLNWFYVRQEPKRTR